MITLSVTALVAIFVDRIWQRVWVEDVIYNDKIITAKAKNILHYKDTISTNVDSMKSILKDVKNSMIFSGDLVSHTEEKKEGHDVVVYDYGDRNRVFDFERYDLLLLRLKLLELRVDSISKKTTVIKNALNPTEADQMLIIPRLNDQVISVKTEFERMEKYIDKEMKLYRDTIIREVDSLSRTTNLIVFAIIPLVVNVLYSMWRDHKNNAITRKERLKEMGGE